MDFKPIGNRTDSSFYQEETAVRFCQCDFSHRLKLSELFRLFSDLAVSAFAFRGMDTRFLLEHQMVFLISRMAVGIRRMPLEGETIRLATWEHEVQRAAVPPQLPGLERDGGTALRSAFRLGHGQPLHPGDHAAAGVYGRPARGGCCRCRKKTAARRNLNACGLNRAKAGQNTRGDRTAVYSDIDGNGHVDNARYLDMAMDLLPAEMAAREPAEVQVLFSRETLPGETPPPLPPAAGRRGGY